MRSTDRATDQWRRNLLGFDCEIVAALQQMLQEKKPSIVCKFEKESEQMPNNE